MGFPRKSGPSPKHPLETLQASWGSILRYHVVQIFPVTCLARSMSIQFYSYHAQNCHTLRYKKHPKALHEQEVWAHRETISQWAPMRIDNWIDVAKSQQKTCQFSQNSSKNERNWVSSLYSWFTRPWNHFIEDNRTGRGRNTFGN